jgi:hypothetical protein
MKPDRRTAPPALQDVGLTLRLPNRYHDERVRTIVVNAQSVRARLH